MDRYNKAKPAAEVYKVAGPAKFDRLRDQSLKFDGSLNLKEFSTRCTIEMKKSCYKKGLKMSKEKMHLL